MFNKSNNNSGKYLVIDYPQENEIINHPNNTIKIGTNVNCKVEVSIDKGDWQPCRFAEGFWWYDWLNCSSGKHKIAARLCDSNGKVLKNTNTRKCKSEISFIR